MSKYDLEKIRQKMKQSQGGPRDPNEFRVPKCDLGKTLNYKFYVLAPLEKGDTCSGGKCSKGMDMYFCIKTAQHYINKRFYTCPRVLLGGTCDLCDYAFELMGETDDKKKRQAIARAFLPGNKWLANIWFPPAAPNPPELHDRVLYFAAPKQVSDIWEETLMRNDAGPDADNPEPFGAFFDETAAFPFLLTVNHQGGYNDYKKSKFAYGQGPRPLADDPKKIIQILNARHDLWTKIDPPSPEKLAEITNSIRFGSNSSSSFDATEQDDDEAPSTASPSTASPSTAASVPAEPAIPQTVADEVPVESKTSAVVVPDDDDDDNDPEIAALMERINSKRK